MIYLQLFWEFFKTGLFAVGGGLATLPFLSDIGSKFGWFTEAELANMVAVAESTPGPIGINMATYAGITVAGIPGALAATFGEVLPAFLIMLLITSVLTKYKQNEIVGSCMRFLRPLSVGMIAAAVLSLIKVALFYFDRFSDFGFWSIFNWKALALAAVLGFLAFKFKKWHPAILIGIGAAAGILFHI